MKFIKLQKDAVFKQINDFNNQPSDPQRSNSSPYAKAYFYVDSNTAVDRASFVNFLIKTNEIKINTPANVMDLAFGSGNLTSHIILDTDIDTSLIVFNDKNTSKSNKTIQIGNISKCEHHDFLVNIPSNDKFNLVIFNPQIGGSYTDGDSALENGITPIISNENIEDYLKNNIDVTFEFSYEFDENNKSLTIHSDNASKSDMIEKLSNVKIWNYYDVFYQSKQATLNGNSTNIVKLRKNLNSIVTDDHYLIFLGEEKHFKSLFADYKSVWRYITNEGKDLFVARKSAEIKNKCYEKDENGNFIINEFCKKTNASTKYDGNLEELFDGIQGSLKEISQVINDNPFGNFSSEQSQILSQQDQIDIGHTVNTEQKGNLEFPLKNILLKGVPGTGKSHTIDLIIQEKLHLIRSSDNILRINIHSASSNADLMQGIGISTNKNEIEYKEKQGLIFDLIRRACFSPKQPFVLVLEEIQENSLNELIGDLIYLIEPEKRAKIQTTSIDSNTSYSYPELIEAYLKESPSIHYVKIPYLVNTGSDYRKMILPDNLYVFCTSNYRDDKKVIEDNLLRRFDVIEIYPQYENFKNHSAANFLEQLNKSTLDIFKSQEIHPDRFQIGHANWLNIEQDDVAAFYKALLKVIIEFKEIREIEFDRSIKKIFDKINLNDGWIKTLFETVKEHQSYETLIKFLQNEVYKEIFLYSANSTDSTLKTSSQDLNQNLID